MPADSRKSVRQVASLLATLIALGLLVPLSASAEQDRTSVRAERQAQRTAERSTRIGIREDRKHQQRAVAGDEAEGATPNEHERGQPIQRESRASAEPAGNGTGESSTARGSARNCSVTVSVSSSSITAGEPVGVLGRLNCQDSTAESPQDVELYEREAGSHGFAMVGSASTESNGSYQLTLTDLSKDSAFYVRAAGTRSKRALVAVTPEVTLDGSPESGAQLFVGGRRLRATTASNDTVTFSGSVSPAAPGTTVALQRENAGVFEGWRRIALGEVGEDGRYSFTHTFGAPGTVNIRVVVRHKGNATVASEPLSYELTRRQNQLLTIQASKGLIASGEPVTISGAAAGAAKQTVTLLAREHEGGFAPVAQATTDEDGNYAFAAQTTAQSTAYRVTCSGKTSTALSVRVTYLLTASASAETVQAGQSVTFAGTALPGQEGHPVYLERQNASGIGFHVIAQSSLDAGAQFSFQQTFESPSEGLLRIKIPSEPGYVGVGSALIKLHVTPAPAGVLVAQIPESPLVASTG